MHEEFIQKERAKQIMQAENDLIAHSVEKSKLYMQGILFGGYAGFFAFWGFMAENMNQYAFVLSGFFMAVSLAVFMACVVWQNIYSSRIILRRLGMLLNAGDDPLAYIKIKEQHDEVIREWHRKTFRSWYGVLVLTIGTALII